VKRNQCMLDLLPLPAPIRPDCKDLVGILSIANQIGMGRAPSHLLGEVGCPAVISEYSPEY
jgi:hypothetical protein